MNIAVLPGCFNIKPSRLSPLILPQNIILNYAKAQLSTLSQNKFSVDSYFIYSSLPNTTKHPLSFTLSLPTLMIPVAKGNPPHPLSIHQSSTSTIVSQTVHYTIKLHLRQCGGAGPHGCPEGSCRA